MLLASVLPLTMISVVVDMVELNGVLRSIFDTSLYIGQAEKPTHSSSNILKRASSNSIFSVNLACRVI